MRKLLLSTTALVAAGLLMTSVAYAQDEDMAEEMMEEAAPAEPVSVGISGSARVTFSASTSDASPTIWEHFEPVISGSATMDNGLTFGVSMVIDASGSWFGGKDDKGGDESNATAYDRKLSIGGAFGDIELGQIKGARAQMRIASAGATSSFGVNGPYTAGDVGKPVGTDGSWEGAAVRQDKIVYKSPSLGGAQIGVSYAPDGAASESIAAALTFTQGLGDASVSVNVGYETADKDGMSPTDLNAGASVSVGDITVSGGMRDSSDGNGKESLQSDIGASLAMGALSVSAGWASTDTTNMYALGAAYPLGEGVQLDLQLDFGDNDKPDASEGEVDEWVQFMIGTAISF